MVLAAVLLLDMSPTAALGYEVDAWGAHGAELQAADAAADADMDARVAASLEVLARRCPTDLERRRRRLARLLYRETGRRTVVPGRPFPRSLGHGRASAFLETGPVDRFDGSTRGAFDGLKPLQSPVLAVAGTASTVSLGGVRVGTDKVDHFLATGFAYWRWSAYGRDPEHAIRRGTRTERLFFGQLTSNAFSYADLRANWDGYTFYAGLLGPSSLLQADEDGCVVQLRPWSWGEWVDPSWDEFVNPSVYGRVVTRVLERSLLEDREAICSEWAAAPRVDNTPWFRGRAPVQQGPLGLAELCALGGQFGSPAGAPR